jgi:hypothetical protein
MAFLSSTGAPVATLPAGHVQNDILLLIVQTSAQTIAAPAGYAEVPNSPQSTGTAAAVNSCALQIFWKRDNGSEVAPTIPASGDHTSIAMVAIARCITTGNPWSYTDGGVISTVQTNPSFTTTSNVLIKGGLLVWVIADGFDNATAITTPVVTNTGNAVIGAQLTAGRPTGGTTLGTGGGFRFTDSTYNDVDATGNFTYSGTYTTGSTKYTGIALVLTPPVANPNNFFDFIYKSTP